MRIVRILSLCSALAAPLLLSAQDGAAPTGGSVAVNILRGLLGLAFLTGLLWLLSRDRRGIPWHLVWKAILLQLVLAFLVLKVPGIADAFNWLSRAFVKVVSFADIGGDFLMASFVTGKVESALINFLFRILPTIIYFSALMALLYYLGLLQLIVKGMAWVMKRTLRISGPESLSTAGNIFLGQTEAPLLIRPYLGGMTRSEMLCIMVGGMASTAGGVLASYVKFLGGGVPAQEVLFAKHLMIASLMSAPATIVASKMLLPEREKFSGSLEISREKIGGNVLEALANGTTDGVKLAVNVGAMLLVFTAFIYLFNYILGSLGLWTGINHWIAAHTDYDGFSLQFVLGYLGAPVTWLMGVSRDDMVLVGQLLGEKTILNEFFAYKTLGGMKEAGALSERSVIIATYILCGFANFASIGIQIGGIGALAPEKRAMLSQLGIRALIGGTIASLFTAVIVGMMI